MRSEKKLYLRKDDQMKEKDIPIWEKSYLTLEQASMYTGIGMTKLRQLSDNESCPFVLWNGSKRLLKRRVLDIYLDNQYSI